MRFARSAAFAFLLALALPAFAQLQPTPRSFEALAESPSAIRCAWLPTTGATGYIIKRDGAEIARPAADAVSYTDSALAPDSTYSYTIAALHGSAVSSSRAYVERTFATFPSGDRRHPARFDVVIDQASTGGVAAAIEAGRRGLKTALIEPTTRPGGMPVNGLCATDLRRGEHASGFFIRFRDRVRALYAAEGVAATGMQYEPGVALQAMKSLLYAAPNITLIRRARLERVNAVTDLSTGRRWVQSVEIAQTDASGNPTGAHAVLSGRVFIDASDCGDLAAWAGARYRVGREARSEREPHAGVIYYDRAHDRLLPGSTGAADRRIMSYAYLLVVKDYGAGADRTVLRPPGYRREDFAHSPPWKESWAATSGRMPGGKYELNQHPQGNDLQAINYGYPEAGYAARARIEQQYRDHVLCYLYYIQTEQGMKQIGLPDDEFRDSGGVPPLLYVREARRIVGEQVPDERSVTEARTFTRPESIGLGDYPMDSHAVRPKRDWSTPDMGEGEWWLYKQTPWHELPIGILVPKDLDNVLVTTAVSSTHVSFGTYRLEPVRMAFGQCAGIMAELMMRYDLAARSIPARQVQEELLPHAANPYSDEDAVLTYLTDLPPGSRHYRQIEYLAARGFRQTGGLFAPAAPTTRRELARLLDLLADRAAPVVPPGASIYGNSVERSARYAYLGAPADAAAVSALRHWGDSDAPITRAELAHWLIRVLPDLADGQRGSGHYADLPDPSVEADAESLYAAHIDPTIWDSWNAFAPDGRLLMRPDAPLRHDDLYAALYIAQIGLGPMFYDSPVDCKNGRGGSE